MDQAPVVRADRQTAIRRSGEKASPYQNRRKPFVPGRDFFGSLSRDDVEEHRECVAGRGGLPTSAAMRRGEAIPGLWAICKAPRRAGF